ncbi:hypothetical protein IJ531_06660 [bacterium]|nr:hypothetical protein [bacterium]
MKTQNINNINFKAIPLDLVSQGLYTLQNNDMLNAAAVDVFAMDTPRTIVEYKYRGKNAGREMAFREYTGTFIAEFSAALFAFLTGKIASKLYKPDIYTNPSSWATNNTLNTFSEIFSNSNGTPQGFVKDTLDSLTGVNGREIKEFSKLADGDKKSIIDSLTNLITNPALDKKQTKEALKTTQDEIIKLLGADSNITIKSANSEVASNLSHALRDIVDVGKNVFFKEGVDINSALSKLKTLNNAKIAIAIPLSMTIAITNQLINRKITKKKTGIDNFVGENNYEKHVEDKAQKDKQKGLWWKKLLSAGVFLLMLTKVMNLKNPADLINKLEFTGPATSGNAIKTVYGTLILGRIFASKDTTELRETNTRDYLGFLSWLVLGGFFAKGVAQMFDPKMEKLFNITGNSKGIKHWLFETSIKSQKEIAAMGGNIKSNLKKLNIAQLSGIAYSAVMLGVLLPKLNIWLTRRKKDDNSTYTPVFKGIDFESFLKRNKK